MLKLPPPVWALVYVLFAVAISWRLDWPKMPGFPLPPLGIVLVTVPWILPVWAIIVFRREGTEVNPISPPSASPYGSAPGQCSSRPSPSSPPQTGSTSRMKRLRCAANSERRMMATLGGCGDGYELHRAMSEFEGKAETYARTEFLSV